MGGAGTLVFLAGVAFFEGSLLRLQQYFLPSPDYEGGLLGGLAERLESAAALVSYNGKSFDVPVLETRYILSRMRPAWRALPHLDLLHPNRRLFKGMFENHRLPRMEQELLGFERVDDCPSHEAPERYFHFQRSGDPTHLLPVLRHNAWDILSLVALAAHLASVVGGDEHPLQAGRAAEYAGDLQTAVAYFHQALTLDLAHTQRVDTFERLARALARLDRWPEAADAWSILCREPHYRRLLPYIELAKLYEHRLKDRARAIAACDEALSLVHRGLIRPGDTGPLSLPALERRHARLVRKLRRS
jgi:tetratricopeptide (TPR) repeat protein